MGGAVSAGRDNNELVDNLIEGKYIRSPEVERVFRALDRGLYVIPNGRDEAYKDLAWKNGPLHLSSPCVYSEVMEGLEVKQGQSFLNIGSGIGYLSTMVGMLLGAGGINHGVEIHPRVVDYALKLKRKLICNSPFLADIDFCEPTFYLGNGLCLAPLQSSYDRVYCGAACPAAYASYFKQLIRIGGILVIPLNDNLMQVKRLGENKWVSRNLLNVSFAPLKMPARSPPPDIIKLEELTPPSLQILARGAIRRALLECMLQQQPELRAPPPSAQLSPTGSPQRPRRICIPLDERPGQFNMLHDLDRENGANEMNALLSLVLSMGENRVAGALRLHTPPSASDEDSLDETPDESPEAEEEPEFDDLEPERRRIDVVFSNFLTDAGDRHHLDASTSPRSLTLEFHDAETSAALGSDGDASGPTSDPKNDTTHNEVPADVQVYLDSTNDLPGTSKTEMEWEESKSETKREPSSDSDSDSISKGNEEKRRKLDSGIWENSPSSSSQKTEKSLGSTGGDGFETDRSSDDTESPSVEVRRRLKRTRARLSPDHAPESAPVPLSSMIETVFAEAQKEMGQRRKKTTKKNPISDTRQTLISIRMTQYIYKLPLPCPMKKFVNWGRKYRD